MAHRPRSWNLIDEDSPIPLYHQLAEYLRDEIERGGLRPGDFFTTEKDLQEQFNVSRATVRRAIGELMSEGLLERVTGKGTFVARPKLKISLPHLVSFSEEIRASGMQPSTKVVSVAWVNPKPSVCQALEVSKNTPVLELRRLRLADGEPLVYMIDDLHPRLGLDDRNDFTNCLFDILEHECGVRLDEATHTIQSVTTPNEIADLLEVDRGSPALRFIRVVYDDEGRPVTYEDAICRGDRYRYSVQLKRQGRVKSSPAERRAKPR